jgi:glutamate-1-semialdehyde aminotransferase
MSTLLCPEEVELAETLLELHPWANLVRYARTGGEALAIAVRASRAATGRDVVAVCGYHGWNDWYLAANLAEDSALDGHLLPGLAPAGVPPGLRGTALAFEYNDRESFEQVLDQAGDRLAAVVMEPCRSTLPAPGFLEAIRQRTTAAGAVLVFDEVTSGFRLICGGAHLEFGIEPDIAVFAKGISNGYPMAAVLARSSLEEGFTSSFISSTYWTERVGPAAALATIEKYRREDVHLHLAEVGSRVRTTWQAAAEAAGLQLEIGGLLPLSQFRIVAEESEAMATQFTLGMLERQVLASTQFYSTFAHEERGLADYDEKVHSVMAALADGTLERPRTRESGFRRLS